MNQVYCVAYKQNVIEYIFLLNFVMSFASAAVLPFLAIYRQIRDFGHRAGDKNLGLAIDRQLPKIRDFEPQNWRNWRNMKNSGYFGDFR